MILALELTKTQDESFMSTQIQVSLSHNAGVAQLVERQPSKL